MLYRRARDWPAMPEMTTELVMTLRRASYFTLPSASELALTVPDVPEGFRPDEDEPPAAKSSPAEQTVFFFGCGVGGATDSACSRRTPEARRCPLATISGLGRVFALRSRQPSNPSSVNSNRSVKVRIQLVVLGGDSTARRSILLVA